MTQNRENDSIYKLPATSLLLSGDETESTSAKTVKASIPRRIEFFFTERFNLPVTVTECKVGPRLTSCELALGRGVKVSEIMELKDELSLALDTNPKNVRMEAPSLSKRSVTLEIPNEEPKVVRLRELIESEAFKENPSKTAVCIGKDAVGEYVFADVAKMPHLLVAGAVGMGKSVCINSIIASILYKAAPSDVRLILIDPKVTEFPFYNGIPHLLTPVINDSKRAAGALRWAIDEMERRYVLIEGMQVRNLDAYNEKVTRDASLGEPLPKIIVVIDELFDLMTAVREAAESFIMCIAQKARAAGIHLIVGTQYPNSDVITGIVKANIPSRISCRVSSAAHSRVILDTLGAESLLDRGDMLYLALGQPKPIRVQGAFISDNEISTLTDAIKAECPNTNYDDSVTEAIKKNAMAIKYSDEIAEEDESAENDYKEFLLDKEFRAAVAIVFAEGKISTSVLQRKLSIGYTKAALYIEIMENLGVIHEMRELSISRAAWNKLIADARSEN